jgi:hypothetical protein
VVEHARIQAFLGTQVVITTESGREILVDTPWLPIAIEVGMPVTVTLADDGEPAVDWRPEGEAA